MGFNFPNSPSVGATYNLGAGMPTYKWDGEKWKVTLSGALDGSVHYDVDQGLSSAQQVQARKNMGAAPVEAWAHSNIIINGCGEVSQEFGNAPTIVPNNTAVYVVDQWQVARNHTANTAAFDAGQGGPGYPIGSQSIYFRSTTAMPVATADYAMLLHKIEGLRLNKLFWGTANAIPITLGWWSSASVTGTYCVSVRNAASTRCYIANVAQATTGWQYNTLTVPGDITGTWPQDNTLGMQVSFCFAAGASWQGSVGWNTSAVFASSAITNFFASNNNAAYISAVSLFPGSDVPQASYAARLIRPYQDELQQCQRYWRKFGGLTALDVFLDAYCAAGSFTAPLTYSHFGMRSTPAWTLVGTFNVVNCNLPPTFIATPNTTVMYVVSIATGQTRFWNAGGAGSYLAASSRL